MDEQQRLDTIAAGTIAIAGVMAICNVLGANGTIDRTGIIGIRDFMLASNERSQATQQLQLHMQQAIEHHFAVLLEAIDAKLHMER